MKEKVNFIVETVTYFNLMHLGLKQHLPFQCIQTFFFLEQIMGNSPEIIHFET